MPTQQVSSRLIRKERSKLMKQTIWYVISAVLIVVIFVLAVLPNFARIMDFVLNTDSSPVSAGDERQVIQPPILSAPVSATNSAQLKIEGNTLPDTEVTIVFNGEQMGKITPQSDGTFSYLATLQDGDNTVTAFSTTKSGVESKTGKEYTIFYDRERPLLEITAPIDKTSFSAKEKVVTVVGTTDTDAKIKLNGRFVFPKADGSFSTQYTLADGENILDIIAVDDAGNEMKTTLTLTYRP